MFACMIVRMLYVYVSAHICTYVSMFVCMFVRMLYVYV